MQIPVEILGSQDSFQNKCREFKNYRYSETQNLPLEVVQALSSRVFTLSFSKYAFQNTQRSYYSRANTVDPC